MMNRFLVVYLLGDQYGQVSCNALADTDQLLQQVGLLTSGMALGIYDAKTELFTWIPPLQAQFDQLSLEDQGRFGHQIIGLSQRLAHQPVIKLTADLPGWLHLSQVR